MGILTWIIFGLIAGAVAKLLMPGRDPGGWIITMLLGIVGAFVGGFIGHAIWGSEGVTGFNLPSFGLAVLGSILLLFLYRMMVRGRSGGTISGSGRRAA